MKVYLTRSQFQDIQVSLESLKTSMQASFQDLQQLFQRGLTRSFPKHRYVEASSHYIEGAHPHRVLYTDYFGKPHSRFLYVIGFSTNSYQTSSQVLESLVGLSQSASDQNSAEFLHVWQERVARLSLATHGDGPGSWHWVALIFDFQSACLQAFSNRRRPPCLWRYAPSGIKPLEVGTLKAPLTPFRLNASTVICMMMGFSDRLNAGTLSEIERHFTALDLHTQNSPIPLLHDQFLSFLHAEGLIQDNGMSMLFRLRDSNIRVIAP